MSDLINPLSDKEYKQRSICHKEDIRGAYFRDQITILHSLPFRRMKHKTQVFFSPNNDHVCTRIEHSLHVATVAETIARSLNLNGELAYAIGLGHDLGHAPFGHSGEIALAKKTKDIGGFLHEIHSLRVADLLGNRGTGLNLTYGVRDGIVCHCGESFDRTVDVRKDKKDLSSIKKRNVRPNSYEGCIARMSDRIAYLGRDLEDAIYGGFVKQSAIPKNVQQALGSTNESIMNSLVIDVINSSRKAGCISLSKKHHNALRDLYSFSLVNIYQHPSIKRYEFYCERIIERLFDYLMDLMSKWGWDYKKYELSQASLDNRYGMFLHGMRHVYLKSKESNMGVVRDYVAGMTDGYALKCMREISLPDELEFDARQY